MLEIIKFKFKKEVDDQKINLYLFEDAKSCIDFLKTRTDITISHIFSDITMPKMDGFALAKEIDKTYGDIDIYMLSALNLTEYKKKAMDANVKKTHRKTNQF